MKNKLFAIAIIFSIIANLFCGILYSVNATETQNAINENVIENKLENKTKNNIANTENQVDNTTENIIENEIENSIKDDKEKNNNVINNTIKNESSKENEIKNTLENTTDSKKEDSKNTIATESLTNNDNGIMVLSADGGKPGVTYRTHVQNIGWQGYVKDGAIAGTSGKSLRLEGINIKLTGNNSNLKIKYQVHVQNIGWQDWKTNGEMAGTSGKSLRLEGIKIKLESTEEYSVMYRVHVQNIGWQGWKTDGEMAGTQGQSLRLEAIQIKIVPKVKKGTITLKTPSNGQTFYKPSTIKVSGSKSANVSNTKIKVYVDSKTTPAVESSNSNFDLNIDSSKISDGAHTIKVVLCTSNNEIIQQTTTKIYIDRQLHVQYRAHVQNIGWQGYVKDGNMAGTSGKCYRVEALNISLINAPSNAKILYRTHVQNIGWQNWQQNGAMAGTTGKSYRVEAIEIKLQNMDKYTVEYQVHIQDKGWTDWYRDGETAGTVGQGKRLEAIRIRLVPKKEKRQYKGIDVSVYNGRVNWGLVKRDGIEFAFIRAGFRGYGSKGTLNEDPYYKLNMQGARQAGVPVGVYFVTQAINENEAREEAYWVLERVRNYKIDYPIAIDIEAPGLENPNDIPRTQNLDKNTRKRIARAFCETIQNAGYRPIIYCNVNWAYNYLNMSELSAYDTWIASYRDNDPGYNGKYSIWQYTSKGQVGGVLGNVDRNICYKKY